jgi:hypothetical protein
VRSKQGGVGWGGQGAALKSEVICMLQPGVSVQCGAGGRKPAALSSGSTTAPSLQSSSISISISISSTDTSSPIAWFAAVRVTPTPPAFKLASMYRDFEHFSTWKRATAAALYAEFRHTSKMTRHTSHVTRHTSHVTRHTSHVTPVCRTHPSVQSFKALIPVSQCKRYDIQQAGPFTTSGDVRGLWFQFLDFGAYCCCLRLYLKMTIFAVQSAAMML